MELVVVGLVVGAAVGLVVGWVAGRLAGIPEGRYRARRDAVRAQTQRDEAAARRRYPRAIGSAAALERDSMAELAAVPDQAPRPGPPRRQQQ